MRLINVVDKDVGDRLKAKRISIGMSPEILAVELGVTNEQIETWETGQARIPPAVLLKISEILGTNASHFFKPPIFMEGPEEIAQNGSGYTKSDEAQTPNSQDSSLVQELTELKEQNRTEAGVTIVERISVKN